MRYLTTIASTFHLVGTLAMVGGAFAFFLPDYAFALGVVFGIGFLANAASFGIRVVLDKAM